MNNSIIIIGCNFIGLYAAIKCADNGYIVNIIEKKSNYNDKRNNQRVFNKKHTSYIQLLNKFNIKYTNYILKYDDRTYNVLANIINKSKLIPNKSLNNQSFVKFCKTFLNNNDYNILKANIESFEYIYNNISAMYAISIFSQYINKKNEYYILTDDVCILIDSMLKYLISKNVKFNYNLEIKNVVYNKHIIVSTINNTYISNLIILTLSKDNLLRFKFFNKEQKKFLNCVTKYNINCETLYNDKYVQEEYEIKNNLLDNVHIVCPIKKHNMYFWDIGINNLFVLDKLKSLFNQIYICSESYSKNPFFANYSLETFDIINNKLINKLSIQ